MMYKYLKAHFLVKRYKYPLIKEQKYSHDRTELDSIQKLILISTVMINVINLQIHSQIMLSHWHINQLPPQYHLVSFVVRIRNQSVKENDFYLIFQSINLCRSVFVSSSILMYDFYFHSISKLETCLMTCIDFVFQLCCGCRKKYEWNFFLPVSSKLSSRRVFVQLERDIWDGARRWSPVP